MHTGKQKQMIFSYQASLVNRHIRRFTGRVRFYIDKKTTHLLYNSLILPYLNYCCMIWGSNYHSQLARLVILQKRAVRLIEHVYPPQSSEPIFMQYNILKLGDIVKSQMLLIMHKFINNQLPNVFENLYEISVTDFSGTRQVNHLKQPFSTRNYRLFTSSYLGPKLWNAIIAPQYPRLDEVPTSKNIMKNIIRRYFIQSYSYNL